MSKEHKLRLPQEKDAEPGRGRLHRPRTTRRRAVDASYRERLRALASEVALAAERERSRIATGLHDELGQLLALAKMKAGAAAATTDAEERDSQLRDLGKVLDEAIRATRSLTFDLGSPMLEEVGLEAALSSLGEEVQAKNGIRVRFESDGASRSLPEEVGLALYQAVRELLFNVVKHAGTRSATVSTSCSSGHLRIAVQDDGVGFDPEGLGRCFDRTGGFGLFSLRERLSYLGGRVVLDSGPGRGTRVVLEMPLRPEWQES